MPEQPGTVPAVVVRGLETVFRRWWALVVPSVIALGAVALLTGTEPSYVSSGTVWVANMSGIDAGVLAPNPNPYVTPAEAQATVMNDLLRTRVFSGAVAARVGYEGPDAYREVQTSVRVFADGTNLLRIQATTVSPATSQALVTAVVDEYQDRVGSEAERATAIATDYFETQVQVAQQELDRRKAELAAYLIVHPIDTDKPTTDLNYLALSGAVESQQKVIEGLLNSLDEVRRQAATTEQSLAAHFSVRDAASSPQYPESVGLTRKFGFPLGGAALGLIVGATYLYFIFRTDHGIRSREECAELGVPVLGVLPVLRSKQRVPGSLPARRLAHIRERLGIQAHGRGARARL